MIIALGLLWTLTTSAFLVAWSRINAHRRYLEGIDEDAYIDGRTD